MLATCAHKIHTSSKVFGFENNSLSQQSQKDQRLSDLLSPVRNTRAGLANLSAWFVYHSCSSPSYSRGTAGELRLGMAFLVVPVVGGAVGGLAGVSLAWSYTKAANTTAEYLYGTDVAASSVQAMHTLTHRRTTPSCRLT